jgi:hypothetical protein
MLRILILAIGLGASVAAVAQVRSIPADARRGLLTHIEGTSVNLRQEAWYFLDRAARPCSFRRPPRFAMHRT